MMAIFAGVLLLAGGAVAAVTFVDWDFAGGENGSESGDRPPGAVDVDGGTVLLVGTRTERGDPQAAWATLLSFDPGSGEAGVVYVPVHTAVEVPGRGLRTLADAYASGGISLFMLSAEPLLDVRLDSRIVLSEKDARSLFQATGPLTMEVPVEVFEARRPVLPQGIQRLSPGGLVKLLYARGPDDDDLDVSSRHIAFWDAFFERYKKQPQTLEDAIRAAAPALEASDAGVAQHAQILEGMARLGRNEPAFAVLPVEPVSAGADELYSATPEQVSAFVTRTLGSVPRPVEEARVQVLNGNGVPGIGEDVAEELAAEGFRVVLTGNARRFDYRKTLIVTYDTTARGTQLAREAAEALGVGKVRVGGSGQGIVDLTIVVGKDFLREH
jgi:polyisoprenyl-teichoic acid--peptidoglycan teichoic acid transferase